MNRERPTPLEVGITINRDTMPDFEPRLGLGPSQGLLLESKRVLVYTLILHTRLHVPTFL